MKKITLITLALIAFQFNYAQDTCATAIDVTPGTTVTVSIVDGSEIPNPECAANAQTPDGRTAGEWYTFTATLDGIANITSDLPGSAGGDTRLHVYEGECGSLVCLGGNDDIDGSIEGQNYLSSSTFPISNGTTYTFAWDDRWDDSGFDFILTETSVDCSTSGSYSYDFTNINPLIGCYQIEDGNADGTTWGYNNGNDVNGDGNNNGLGIIFPQAAGVAKDEWLFLPVFNGVANADYELTITYNAFNNPGTASESLEIVALDEPSSTASMQTVLGSFDDITQNGAGVSELLPNAYSSSATYTPSANGDFYFAVHANTAAADSGILMLFSVSVSETLGLNEFEQNKFSYSYSRIHETLNLESSNIEMSNVEIYSLLGQNVVSRKLSNTSESINISSLTDGIYLAKVNINGNSKTVKFIKN